jgi:hypothetical protein
MGPSEPEQQDGQSTATTVDENVPQSGTSLDREAPPPSRAGPPAQQPASAASMKSVKLRAFNLYAAKVRKETKDQNPSVLGYEIERLIGKKWAKLTEDERKEFMEQATKEREDMIQDGSIKPEMQEKARKKKRKNDSDLLALTSKQKWPQTKEGVLQHMPGLVKPKKRSGERRVDASTGDGSAAAALIGTPVSGLIDGMFDAGFFVSLKVGDKKQVFKGVIFRPDVGLSGPGRSDIAPKVWTLDTKAAAKQPESGDAQTLGQAKVSVPVSGENLDRGAGMEIGSCEEGRNGQAMIVDDHPAQLLGGGNNAAAADVDCHTGTGFEGVDCQTETVLGGVENDREGDIVQGLELTAS